MDQADPISCPFCGYNADGDYQIMLHMETQHPENGESPFIVKEDAASMTALHDPDNQQDEEYVMCPHDGCGEALLLTELESHIEMHEEEQDSPSPDSDDSGRSSKRIKLQSEFEFEEAFDTRMPRVLRNLDDVEVEVRTKERKEPARHVSAKAAWKSLLKMPDTSSRPINKPNTSRRRLGKSELGPHANEEQMPSWLVKLLEKDGEVTTTNQIKNGKTRRVKFCPNMAAGVVPVLAQLLDQDQSVEYAFLCDPAVKHVSKLRREGGFCGYRNIQMMCSYIIGAKSQGHEGFNDQIPSIFQIQDYIETAWDLGINDNGRVETGGIRGTRKYIGTPDAQAMFCSIGIACDAQGVKTKASSKPAHVLLFEAVETYFRSTSTPLTPRIRSTSLPPIYFQHPGHSMTIIGIERRTDGSKNLIVFDPMFHDAANVTKLVDTEFRHKNPGDLMRAYRRGVKYLKKYSEFELLKLVPPKRAVSNSADDGRPEP